MAPKVPMRTAPEATKIVPAREYLVNGSLKIMDAHIELKTSPDC
jgi:hypothetical protein